MSEGNASKKAKASTTSSSNDDGYVAFAQSKCKVLFFEALDEKSEVCIKPARR
jgi:hypothetical protein